MVKKIWITILGILVVFLCGSCNGPKGSADVVTTKNEKTTASDITTQTEKTTIDIGPPRIVPPDEIEVMPLDQDPFPAPYKRQYRLVYNEIRGSYIDLVDDDDFNNFYHDYENKNPFDVEISEMFMITFIKEFQIPRKDFEKALALDWQKRVRLEWDTSLEMFELPNPDIIYTFDNEIINAYYRRENPVAPDWLGTERAKDFTYESYSEYLKANPQ